VKYSTTHIGLSPGLEELSRLTGNNFDLLRRWIWKKWLLVVKVSIWINFLVSTVMWDY